MASADKLSDKITSTNHLLSFGITSLTFPRVVMFKEALPQIIMCSRRGSRLRGVGHTLRLNSSEFDRQVFFFEDG